MADALTVVCPTCRTRINPSERCESSLGSGRCMASQGHGGWHWTDMGQGGITRWTGLYVERRACPARLDENDNWCRRGAGHEGAHNNGRGVSFGDPIPDEGQGDHAAD